MIELKTGQSFGSRTKYSNFEKVKATEDSILLKINHSEIEKIKAYYEYKYQNLIDLKI